MQELHRIASLEDRLDSSRLAAASNPAPGLPLGQIPPGDSSGTPIANHSPQFILLTRKETIMYLRIIAVAWAVAFMAGCNTMEGAGKDIKKGGESIEQSAEKHKNSN
jgi:entericidin B